MIHIAACTTDFSLDDRALAALSSHVGHSRRERAGRFLRREDRIRSLIAGALVLYAIGTHAPIEPSPECIGSDTHGRPIVHGHPDLHLSISHAGDWVICALAGVPVGIDVEQIRDAHVDVASGFFATGELVYLYAASTTAERRQRFFEIWTAKESYTKALGLGLGLSLRSFDTCAPIVPGPITDRTGANTGYVTRGVPLSSSHVGMLCVPETSGSHQVEYLSEDDLLLYHSHQRRVEA